MNVYGRTYKYDYQVHHTPDIPYRHTFVNETPVPGILNPQTVHRLNDFQFRDGDIVVASYQKAGSIILRVMVQMLLGLSPMQDSFHWLEVDGNAVKQEAHVTGRRLLRTHLPFDWLPETPCHVTYLFMYPADPDFILSLYSHFHTSLAIGYQADWDTFFRLWTSEKVFYGSFYKHRASWTSHVHKVDMIVWPYIRDQVDRSIIAKIASKIWSPITTRGMASTVPQRGATKQKIPDYHSKYPLGPDCERDFPSRHGLISDHDTKVKHDVLTVCDDGAALLKTCFLKSRKDPVHKKKVDIGDNMICGDNTTFKVDDTTFKVDDLVTREKLITEVFQFISQNNPLAVWRTDREKKLLKEGLKSLNEHHRHQLELERLKFSEGDR